MFESITPASIKAAILAEIDTDLNTGEGSFLSDLVTPVAMEIWKCYQSLNALIPIAFVDESSGGYIDLECAKYGITRKAGTKAAAAMTFSGTSGTVIPAGTAFLTAGGLEFDLTAAVTLASGTGSGTVEASTAGDAYNVGAGEITNMVTAIAGLSSFSNAAATGGTDEEADTALVSRLTTYRQKPATSGNAYHYEQWALETDGVGAAKVTPLWDGAGTVKVLIAGSDMGPVDSSVVTACAAAIEENRPIGATVTVESAEALTINVAATVTIDGTTTKAAVQTAFSAALETYLQSISFVKYTLLYNRIAYMLLDIAGVTDYSVLTVNGGTVNITIGDDQVPVVGTVTVS